MDLCLPKEHPCEADVAEYLEAGCRTGISRLDIAGCGLCVENCPNGALRLWGSDPARPYWTYSCESCMRCMGYCPEQAVEAGHSLA